MSSIAPIKMSECMKQITLNVKITGWNVHKIRMFFSIQLIKLAALIAGCGIKIEMDKNDA